VAERVDPVELLSARTDPVHRPPADAEERIRSRMTAAYEADAEAATQLGHGPVLVQEPSAGPDVEPEERGSGPSRVLRPHRWRRMTLVAAAVLAVVVAVAAIVWEELPDRSVDTGVANKRTAALVPPSLDALETWSYRATDADSGVGATVTTSVVVTDVGDSGESTVATVRVRTTTATRGTTQGSASLIREPGAYVVPAALLDPTAGLVDCEPESGVRISLTGGRPSALTLEQLACGSRVTGIGSRTLAPRRIDVAALDRAVEATPVQIEWELDGTPRTTTWWLADGLGVVRIDVEDPTDPTTTITHELIAHEN
jgi:hypothetical protein